MSFIILTFFLFIIVRHNYFWKARHDIIFKSNKPTIIAHRGCTRNYPENTTASFVDAVKYGFNFIEFDVCHLKDGTLICSHNWDLERETDGKDWVHNINKSDLSLIKTGVYSHPKNLQPIPTLKDVLKKMPDNINLNIEIKCKSVFDFSTAISIGKLFKSGKIKHSFIVSCFNPFVIGYLRLFYPSIYVGYLVDDKRMFNFIKWIHPDYLHIDAALIDNKIFNYCDSHSVGINVWTVNSVDAAEWCLDKKVLGIITDNYQLLEVV